MKRHFAKVWQGVEKPSGAVQSSFAINGSAKQPFLVLDRVECYQKMEMVCSRESPEVFNRS